MPQATLRDYWLVPMIRTFHRVKQPGMFIGGSSVREFQLFLAGYVQARADVGMDRFGGDTSVLEDFSAWLGSRLGLEGGGWMTRIEAVDSSPENFKRTFVPLFMEYIATLGHHPEWESEWPVVPPLPDRLTARFGHFTELSLDGRPAIQVGDRVFRVVADRADMDGPALSQDVENTLHEHPAHSVLIDRQTLVHGDAIVRLQATHWARLEVV